MDDLIARLEAAPEGSRELDARIDAIRRPREWIVPADGGPPIPRYGGEAPDYTTSLDAKLPGEHVVIVADLEGIWHVIVRAPDGMHVSARAATEPLGRRAAALKARQHAAASTSPTTTTAPTA